MDPQQLPKTSKLYSKCKKCDMEKTLGEWAHPLLVARRLTGARPACQRRARLAMGRRLDKLSPEESCDLAGPALKSAVVFFSEFSLCLRWLLWFMLKTNSVVSLTCQKHSHFLWRQLLMQETYTFNSI